MFQICVFILNLYIRIFQSVNIQVLAEQSKASTVYEHLNIEITDLNPARDMGVCLRVSVLCCSVFR
jgi:hypothetical protein